jgi:hypothetical protein
MSAVTRILSALEQGDPHAADQLLPLVYDALRQLAAQKLAGKGRGRRFRRRPWGIWRYSPRHPRQDTARCSSAAGLLRCLPFAYLRDFDGCSIPCGPAAHDSSAAALSDITQSRLLTMTDQQGKWTQASANRAIRNPRETRRWRQTTCPPPRPHKTRWTGSEHLRRVTSTKCLG